jgi:hypothetical protein
VLSQVSGVSNEEIIQIQKDALNGAVSLLSFSPE